MQKEDNSYSPTRRPWQTKTLQAPSTLLDAVSLGIIFSELDREEPSMHEISKAILHCYLEVVVDSRVGGQSPSSVAKWLSIFRLL